MGLVLRIHPELSWGVRVCADPAAHLGAWEYRVEARRFECTRCFPEALAGNGEATASSGRHLWPLWGVEQHPAAWWQATRRTLGTWAAAHDHPPLAIRPATSVVGGPAGWETFLAGADQRALEDALAVISAGGA